MGQVTREQVAEHLKRCEQAVAAANAHTAAANAVRGDFGVYNKGNNSELAITMRVVDKTLRCVLWSHGNVIQVALSEARELAKAILATIPPTPDEERVDTEESQEAAKIKFLEADVAKLQFDNALLQRKLEAVREAVLP